MASFLEHVTHAKSNLKFLDNIDKNVTNYWDWKVTTTFYTALHAINAHLSSKLGFTYRSHKEVNNAINPYKQLSPGKLDEDTYKSYQKLYQLSRRSRYLIHEKNPEQTSVCSTYDIHFSRALTHLENIIVFIENEYDITFDKIFIDCEQIKSKSLKHFAYKKN